MVEQVKKSIQLENNGRAMHCPAICYYALSPNDLGAFSRTLSENQSVS